MTHGVNEHSSVNETTPILNGKKSECFPESKRFYFPRRYILVLLGSWGVFNIFTLRTSLSVAIVAMVNMTATSPANDSFQVDECPELAKSEQPINYGSYKGEKYNWDIKTQSHILGAFFYTYVLTQLPGGILSEKIGYKWLFGGGIMGTTVLVLLIPLAARLSTSLLIALRAIAGFGEGCTFPALNFAISTWAPKTERSRTSTIFFSGGMIGNVVAMAASGAISSSDALGGWPSVFYIFGAIGCIWFVLWSFFIYETPASHPTISKEELLFIEQNKDEIQSKKAPIPWKSIFTSVPFWALLVTHFGNDFGYLMMLSEMPTYLSTALHFDIQSNGLLSSLPYIAQAVGAWTSSYVADKLRENNTLSITSIRKLFNSIGFFGPAICLIGVTLSGCRPLVIVALLTLGIGLNGSIYSGYNVTHVDMCPEFAGTLFGITNTIACCNGFIGPLVVGAFTSNGTTLTNWNKVFYTTAAVNIVTGIVFVLFGSAALQPWDTTKKEAKLCSTFQKKLIDSEKTRQCP